MQRLKEKGNRLKVNWHAYDVSTSSYVLRHRFIQILQACNFLPDVTFVTYNVNFLFYLCDITDYRLVK